MDDGPGHASWLAVTAAAPTGGGFGKSICGRKGYVAIEPLLANRS
jgi:hypothetical protein